MDSMDVIRGIKKASAGERWR